jgi:uncharacterized protein GlcG (DUF336 family)
MSQLIKNIAAASVASAAMIALSANAAPLMQQNMSVADAWKVIDAVNAECGQPGRQSMTIAVIDRAGDPVVMIRADSASPHNWNQVYRKAYTARTFRRPSAVWRDDSAPGDEREGQRQLTNVLPLAGGAPIFLDDDVIGAVGVSGASGGQPADDACAQAAAAAVAAQLE